MAARITCHDCGAVENPLYKCRCPPGGLHAANPNEWTPVWRRVITSPAVKSVGSMACTFADWGDGTNIFPGTAVLAAVSGCTERTVINALAQIRAWGLMWRYVEGSKHGRRKVADEYRLTLPDDLLDGRVPLLPPKFTEPDHLNSDHLNSDQVNSAAGTGEIRGADQVNSLHPTSTRNSPDTQTSARGPAVGGSVEGARVRTSLSPDLSTAQGTAAAAMAAGSALSAWDRRRAAAAS